MSHNILNTPKGLYVFGNNDHGQLGLGSRYVSHINIPTKLKFFDNSFEIISVHYGGYHTIINTTKGLYVFGYNLHGQLGLGHYEDREHPTKLKFSYEIISIHCGQFHTVINTINGLYVFGSNIYGQLGLGDHVNRLEPTKLQFESKYLEILSIYCGENYTMVNTTDGLYVFGSNYYGQLGLGDQVNQYIPTKLEFPYEILSNCLKKRFKNIKSANSCS